MGQEQCLGLICTLAGVVSVLITMGWLVRREIRRQRAVLFLTCLREEITGRPRPAPMYSPLRSLRSSGR